MTTRTITEAQHKTNTASLREGVDLLRASKARVIGFELVAVLVRDAKAVMYHVTIERLDDVLEEPRSFYVPLAQVSLVHAFVSADCLRSTAAFEHPRVGYGSGDDGLRALAPDNAEFVSTEHCEESRVCVSCMPHTSDRITVDRHSLDASEAVKLGRMLVWMGQRVHMRLARQKAGLAPPVDLVREMDRERNGYSSSVEVDRALVDIGAGTCFVSFVHGSVLGCRFEVHIQFRAKDVGYGLVVTAEQARMFEATMQDKT